MLKEQDLQFHKNSPGDRQSDQTHHEPVDRHRYNMEENKCCGKTFYFIGKYDKK